MVDGRHGPGHRTWSRTSTPGRPGSFPADLTSVDGKLAFAATEDSTGTELYETDGTTAGTVLIEDLRPGTDSSNPSDLTDVDGTLFFAADDAVAGAELWISDGTEAGTSVVEDINPNGSDGSNPQGLRAANGALYFAADDGSNGTELWISDGSAAGTSMLDDINPGTDSSDPGELTELNGTLFFAASTELNGRELWAKNLSGGPSYLVSDINPGMIGSVPASGFPAGLTVLNNRILFKAAGGLVGQGLWSSDGTTLGTTQLHAMDSMSQALKRVGSTVFFVGFDSVHGSELWKSDGSSAGTQVLDVTPGSSDTAITLGAGFATAQGRLFFAAGTDNELWSSDGTVAGTGEVANINPTGPGSPHNLVDIQGRLHFAADDGTRGSELWRTRIDLDPTINSGPTGPTNQVRPTFTFSSNDDLATYTCSLDTGTPSFGACSGALSHQPAADLAEGDYVFRVRATDDLGNFATAARAFSVDTVVPTVSITGGPTGNTTDQRPTFTFDAEAGTTLQCSIDTGSASFGPCSGASSHQPSRRPCRRPLHLPGPRHRRRGERDDRDAHLHGRRRHAPDALDHRRPDRPDQRSPPGLQLRCRGRRDPGVLDRHGNAQLRALLERREPSAGVRPRRRRLHVPRPATDAASNATTRTRDFSVDATPPTLSITGGPIGPTDDQRPTFTFDAEAGATVECSIDTGTRELRLLLGRLQPSAGVRPRRRLIHLPRPGDRRGRQFDHPDARLQRRHRGAEPLDHRRPVGSDQRPAAPRSPSTPRPVRRWSARSTPGPRASVPAPGASSHQPAADLADGDYTFRVRATDAAGNATAHTAQLQRRRHRAVAVDHRRPELGDQRSRARPSPSTPSPARRVECSIDTGTAELRLLLRRLAATSPPPTSPTARTRSACGRPTRPAIPPRRFVPSASTPPRRRCRSPADRPA